MKLQHPALLIFLALSPGPAFSSVLISEITHASLHGTKVTSCGYSGYIGVTDQMRRQTDDIYALLYSIRQAANVNRANTRHNHFTSRPGRHR